MGVSMTLRRVTGLKNIVQAEKGDLVRDTHSNLTM